MLPVQILGLTISTEGSTGTKTLKMQKIKLAKLKQAYFAIAYQHALNYVDLRSTIHIRHLLASVD